MRTVFILCKGMLIMVKETNFTKVPRTKYAPPFCFVLFCFLTLSYLHCLCILEINLLLVASFADIFSQSIGCLFILFLVSFAV